MPPTKCKQEQDMRGIQYVSVRDDKLLPTKDDSKRDPRL